MTRPLTGYGPSPPPVRWPGGAALAVSLVVNFEEGGELTILNGDGVSESRLADLDGAAPVSGTRDLQVESLYEYGSRVGIWRLLRFFRERELPFTAFAVGRALQLNPGIAEAILEAGGELVPHGWRWLDYRTVTEAVEREEIARCAEQFKAFTGTAPLGWYTGRTSENTRRLVVEHGGFLYDSDAYNDDLPYWDTSYSRPHLVIPYALDSNDGRLAAGGDFGHAAAFGGYLTDTFDWLLREGRLTPRMMSVGLHCRIVGRPGRMSALARFVDHAQAQGNVWFCRRAEIARHWLAFHAPTA